MWKHRDKVMCGLRYFDNVEYNRNDNVLSEKALDKIGRGAPEVATVP